MLPGVAPGTRAPIRRRGDTLGNALALFTTTILTSAFGFAFWWVVARAFKPEAVGAAAAALAVMQLIAIVAMVGLGTLLIAELSRGERHPAEIMTTAVLVALLLGGVLGAAFAGIAAAVAGGATAALQGPVGVTVFAATVASTAALLVLDDAMIGLSRASWQVWRNLVFAAAKLALLPAALVVWTGDDPRGVVAAWLGGVLVSFAALLVLARRGGEQMLGRPRAELLGELRRLALEHHWLNLSAAAPRLVLPLLVAVALSTVTNAYFYAALLVATFAHIVPSHLSTALFAIASGERSALKRELRRTFVIFAAVAVVAPLIFAAAGGLILSTFGPGYGRAARTLTIIGLGTFATGVKSYYMAVARVNGDLSRAAILCSLGSGLEIGVAMLALAAGAGIDTLSVAWVAVMAVEGLVFWPAVAVAGELPLRPRGRLVQSMRWSAPRTLDPPSAATA